MYRSLSGPSGLKWFLSVAVAASALTASSAFATISETKHGGAVNAIASGMAARPTMANFRALTREEAAKRIQATDLFRAPVQNMSVNGGGINVVCGDGLPSPGAEQCDDGNLNNGDGCSTTCQIEVPFACTEATGTSPINDEGFELGGLLTNGTPNPNWAETGTQNLGGGVFFTPICSEDVCLGDPNAELAIEGEFFGWFGGFEAVSPSPQVQTVTQTRTIAAARTRLTYYTLRGICFSGNADSLVLTIDNNVVQTVTCNAVDADWVLQTVDLTTAPGGPYNNGANHTMKWTGTTRGGGDGSGDFTNIFLDFVNLTTGAYPSGVTPVPSSCANSCGNSSPDGTEECDDGNNNNGDGCSATCTVEAGWSCTDAIPAREDNAVQDGGYELGGLNDGAPNPFWTEAFTINAFPPICSEATCGADIANSGFYFTWGGGGAGTGTPETQSTTQAVTIPSEVTTLDFFTLRGICSPAHTDNLKVTIDGNVVFTLICDAAELNYVPQSVNLVTAPGGPYNDGDSHTLVFTTVATDATNGANDHTNFFVDDIVAGTGEILPPVPSQCREFCFSENFDGPTGGDLTGWTVFNTGALDIDWGTTDDGFCGSSGNWPLGNWTGGTGEAACVDSDAAGPGLVDAYLCSPQYNYGSLTNTELQVLVNYQVFGAATPEDIFELLSGTAAPGPGTIGGYESLFATNANLGAFAAAAGVILSGPITPQDGFLCFHYAADFDWYAQIDDLGILADSCAADADNDGLSDSADNCINVANNGQPNTGPAQNDTDGDGIGNMCDADFDNNCSVNFTDLGEMKAEFFHTGALEEDMDGSGSVNFADLGLLKAGFFLPPGPSGVPNVCSP